MTTILLLNAVSFFVATAGIGGFLMRKIQRARRTTVVQPLYVTTRTSRPAPRP
jgi:hypothetical protein